MFLFNETAAINGKSFKQQYLETESEIAVMNCNTCIVHTPSAYSIIYVFSFLPKFLSSQSTLFPVILLDWNAIYNPAALTIAHTLSCGTLNRKNNPFTGNQVSAIDVSLELFH